MSKNRAQLEITAVFVQQKCPPLMLGESVRPASVRRPQGFELLTLCSKVGWRARIKVP
jgi:hypothetical protein